jgi:hypothetical protein
MWGCERFEAKKSQLWMDLRLTDTEWGTPIKDILEGETGRVLQGAALSVGAAN